MKQNRIEGKQSFTVTDLRKDPGRVIEASRDGEVLITRNGEPIAALRWWVQRGKGKRAANERREELD